ncbi:MAG: flavodoxin family protein [Oscillospiraceae bacterium]|jgi:multimeric flavodoxin WrbA|nr:flavodoxin family protein [Oscillospiraceae bacterium]
MKVTLINGSPRENGTTAYALGVIAGSLNAKDVKTEIITVGAMNLRGCLGCGGCRGAGKCVTDDGLNEIAAKMRAADGVVIGSPVYYAGINGTLKCFLDRAFYSGAGKFRFKPAAGAVAMRRAGGTAALQTINQYFELAEMLITPTIYWSGIHGLSGEQAGKDAEGVQMMEVIGANMAYLIKMKNACGLPEPPDVVRARTNFIR